MSRSNKIDPKPGERVYLMFEKLPVTFVRRKGKFFTFIRRSDGAIEQAPISHIEYVEKHND